MKLQEHSIESSVASQHILRFLKGISFVHSNRYTDKNIKYRRRKFLSQDATDGTFIFDQSRKSRSAVKGKCIRKHKALLTNAFIDANPLSPLIVGKYSCVHFLLIANLYIYRVWTPPPPPSMGVLGDGSPPPWHWC